MKRVNHNHPLKTITRTGLETRMEKGAAFTKTTASPARKQKRQKAARRLNRRK